MDHGVAAGDEHLTVVDDGGDGLCNDIADWCEADFEVMPGTTLRPVSHEVSAEQFGILSPKIGEEPHLNAPYVFGVRPTHPLLFTVPCSGTRPMTFSAKGLPAGVTFDAKTGILTGAIAGRGEYPVTVTATNAKGTATRTIRLAVGDTIALTPPMGWNSWNIWGEHFSGEHAMSAAKADIVVLDEKAIAADPIRIGLKGSPTKVVTIFPPPVKGGGRKIVWNGDAAALAREIKEAIHG